MKVRLSTTLSFLMCALIILLTTGCGARYMVKGQVVDAKNGKPIKGASIAIHWIGKKTDAFFAPYANGGYTIEKTKEVSDVEGFFIIPKYVVYTEYEMGVYKKGYVCWSSRKIFLKGEPIKDRTDYRVRDGMVIELEPFTATDMKVRARHASFVVNISRVSGGLSGIGDEVKFYRKYYWNK